MQDLINGLDKKKKIDIRTARTSGGWNTKHPLKILASQHLVEFPDSLAVDSRLEPLILAHVLIPPPIR